MLDTSAQTVENPCLLSISHNPNDMVFPEQSRKSVCIEGCVDEIDYEKTAIPVKNYIRQFYES